MSNLSKEQYELIEQETQRLLSEGIVMSKEASDELNKILEETETIIKKDATDETWVEYKESISRFYPVFNDHRYNFQLTKNEYSTLRDIIFSKMNYDRNNIYQALVLRDNFFIPLEKELGAKNGNLNTMFKNNDDIVSIETNMREIKRISDLLSGYIIKGLTKEAEEFANIFKKIGDIMRIFEYFYQKADDLGNRASTWTALGIKAEEEALAKSEEA